MAYDIVVDGNEFDLASINGFKKMRYWITENGGPVFLEFLENNETDRVPELRKEIVELLATRNDIPRGVRSTLDFMVSVSLKLGKTAYVTDGFSADE